MSRQRLVFLKDIGKKKPHPKLASLIARARSELVYKRFRDVGDLTDLVDKGLLERLGTTGKGTGYVLRKGAIKGPKGPLATASAKGAAKGSKGPLVPEPVPKSDRKKGRKK